MSFVSYQHLILLISGQTFEVTVAHENFWKLNKLLSHQKESYYLKILNVVYYKTNCRNLRLNCETNPMRYINP